MQRTLLLAAALALVCIPVQAEELTRFILVQPLSHVREICADPAILDEIERRLRASLGCITLQRATDNPNDVICLLRIPAGLMPWDQETLLERLRPLCLEQP